MNDTKEKEYDGIYQITPPDWLQPNWLVVNVLSWKIVASCTSYEAARAAIRLRRIGQGRQ